MQAGGGSLTLNTAAVVMLRVGLVGGEEDLMVVAKAGISDNVDECDCKDTTARSSAISR